MATVRGWVGRFNLRELKAAAAGWRRLRRIGAQPCLPYNTMVNTLREKKCHDGDKVGLVLITRR